MKSHEVEGMAEPGADEILRNAAHHLMDGTNIWYDLVANERGDRIYGPEYQAVMLLCRMASDLRVERMTP